MIRFSPSGLGEYFGRLPTTDLYVLNPLAELRRRSPALPRLKNLAANVYAVGHTGIVVRYGQSADIELLRQNGAERIVYVVDDDFAAGAADARLPEGYRKKLAAFAEGAWRPLQEAADIVVVPGSILAGIYGDKARVVPPAWRRRPKELDHFAAPGRLEIVHLGTGSHRTDLADIAPALVDLLAAHKDARLTLLSGDAAPRKLASHPHVRVLKRMPWWLYRRAQARMRFHLAIYPLGDTPFNRARSASKLYEHAIVGAASLLSPIPALQVAAGPDIADVFVEGGVAEWAERLEADLADRDGIRRRAERTRAHIMAADPLAEAARQWGEILAPEL